MAVGEDAGAVPAAQAASAPARTARRPRARGPGRAARRDVAAQASSRRMTGKRSSATARTKPDRFPEPGGRRARRVRPRPDLRIGLDRGEAAARQVLADRGDEGVRQTGAAGLGRGGDAGDDRRERRVRQGRIEVARPLGAWVGGQRSELRVDLGHVVLEQDLGVAPGDPEAAAEQLELARRLGPDGRPPDGWRRERVVDRAVVDLAGGQERVGRTGGRERVGGGRGRLEIGEERVRRARLSARPRPTPTRRRTAPATTAVPPSTRGRRPPSSRTSDGRSRDRRRAGSGRTSRRR